MDINFIKDENFSELSTSDIPNNGNVILIKDAGWSTRDYIEECEMFPSGTYSDQVDASFGCFNLMLGVKAKAGTWGKR